MKLALPILVLLCGTMKAAADEPAISLNDVPKWGWGGDGFKVEPFIEAAARLQALGKESAQKLLLELADWKKPSELYEARMRAIGLTGDRLETAVAQELFRAENQRRGLFILCRMLFTAKPKAEFRRAALGGPCWIGRNFSDWPLEPIEITDGVPFLIVQGYNLAGFPEPIQMYLDYCIKNCDWNTFQFKLKSEEEKQKALEKVLASPKLKQISAEDRAFLRSQIDIPDILVADFEGATYGEWRTTGTAFGKRPARGTLPGQMQVSGFLGKGLVNSFVGGDKSTGTLTSPEFKIERKYLNFLVGGGAFPVKTCVNLLVGGKVVRTAIGPNDKAGGTEHLDWHTWDVGEYGGKMVSIQIVDDATGGWGHINADHFVQSDKKKQAAPANREIAIDKKYLYLPVKTGAPMKRMKFVVGKETVREFDIELAEDKPQFWAFADVSAFKGKTITVETVLPADSKALDALKLADDVPAADKLYQEKHRPLFHFTSRFGWLNDPNGLVYADGEWHLFYQHNPFGVNWGNMHWGHAVSPDLVHWKELGIGLYPKKYGDWAFSGSAVVDKGNTSGWGTKEKPPLVLAYTSTGRGECIAYSTDKGRTWTEYDKNPVVKHPGRDPKLVWYEKGKHWVMAVYDEHEKKQWIAFYTSPDLKTWTFASRIEGFFECPDLFEMPVDILGKSTKWVLYAADGKYLIGDFDGKQFKPDFKEKKQLWYGRFYAAQSFDSAPDWEWKGGPGPSPPPRKRRVQIGWANGVTFPGMPFNQQMNVPVDLSLANDGQTLFAAPIIELETLREKQPAIEVLSRGRGVTWTRDEKTKLLHAILASDLDAFDMEIRIRPGKSKQVTLDLRGTKLTYDTQKETLTCKNVTAPVKLDGGDLNLRVLVDRGSVEVFAGFGRIVMSVAAIPDEKNRRAELIQSGNDATVPSATIYRLKSAWAK